MVEMCVSFFSFLFIQLFHHQMGPPKRIERDAKLGEKTFTANRKLASFSQEFEYLSVRKLETGSLTSPQVFSNQPKNIPPLDSQTVFE